MCRAAVRRAGMDITSKDGTTIAVDRVGSGPSVVCVGGALNDRTSTGHVATRMPGFTVYSYDRRGRGGSGDGGAGADRLAREIEDLAAVLDAAGGAAAVYGMSSGGVLALRAAAAGLPITRLALYEPPVTGSVPGAPAGPADYAARLDAAIAEGRPRDALELFMVELIGTPAEMFAGLSHAPMWPALLALAPSLRYDAAAMGDNRIPADAPEVTVPATVLTGTASPEFLRAAGRALAAALPAGVHVELADQTHDVDPAVLAEALVSTFS